MYKDNYLVSYGAAEEVTGSMHLVCIDVGKDRKIKILLDAGSFQGLNSVSKNAYLPKSIDVSEIDYIFLTHAHLDHVGRLPILVQRGFTGEIICTPVTRDITYIVLSDALKIQDEDEERGIPRLWEEEDLEKVKKLFNMSGSMMADYPEWSWKDERGNVKIRVKFIPSEHIIGSGSILIEEPIKLLYTGDLGGGRSGMHIVPKLPDDVGKGRERGVDYLIIESTYGDRPTIDTGSSALNILKAAIEDMRKSRGRLLIATLAVDRTEEILMMLKKLGVKEKVYLDSPMGADLLRIYIHNRYLLSRVIDEWGFDINRIDNDSVDEAVKIEEMRKIFRPDNFEVITTRRRSKEVADSNENCIVIASSGMLEGGRIMGHLPGVLEGEKNILLFTGYQALGTLGRDILDGSREIEVKTKKKAPHLERNLIFESDFVDTNFDGDKDKEIIGEIGYKIKIRCSVRKIEGLSAHADQSVLLEYINGFEILPSKIFIVHGEKNSVNELERKIKEKFRVKTVVSKFDVEYGLSETDIVEKVVVKDVSNVDSLVNMGVLKFFNVAKNKIASFAGWVLDSGGDYKLISQDDVQDIMINAIPKIDMRGIGVGRIGVGTIGIEETEEVLSEEKKLAIASICKDEDIPSTDELVSIMTKAFKDGFISKGLVKGLFEASQRGVGEYMKVVDKRIKGRDIILDDIELEKRGKTLNRDERDEMLGVFGGLLKRSCKMDMKILGSALEKINDEIMDM